MMENVIGVIMVVLMALLGGLPTIYLTVSIPVVIDRRFTEK